MGRVKLIFLYEFYRGKIKNIIIHYQTLFIERSRETYRKSVRNWPLNSSRKSATRMNESVKPWKRPRRRGQRKRRRRKRRC